MGFLLLTLKLLTFDFKKHLGNLEDIPIRLTFAVLKFHYG